MIIIYPSQHEYIKAEYTPDAEIVAYFSDTYTIKVVANSVNGHVGEMLTSIFQEKIIMEYK